MGEATYGCLIKESSDIKYCWWKIQGWLYPLVRFLTQPASCLPPRTLFSFHSCLETLDHWTKPWEGLLEDPLSSLEEIWYTDGSSFVLDGKRRAEYAVVSNFEPIEAKPFDTGYFSPLSWAHSPDSSFRAGKRKKSSHLHWLQVCLSGTTCTCC